LPSVEGDGLSIGLMRTGSSSGSDIVSGGNNISYVVDNVGRVDDNITASIHDHTRIVDDDMTVDVDHDDADQRVISDAIDDDENTMGVTSCRKGKRKATTPTRRIFISSPTPSELIIDNYDISYGGYDDHSPHNDDDGYGGYDDDDDFQHEVNASAGACDGFNVRIDSEGDDETNTTLTTAVKQERPLHTSILKSSVSTFYYLSIYLIYLSHLSIYLSTSSIYLYLSTSSIYVCASE